MAENVLSTEKLFPAEIVNEIFSKVRGFSSLAALSKNEGMPFPGKEMFTFTMDDEVNIVAENGAHSAGKTSFGSVTMVPIKMEYGTRVSREFLKMTQEEKVNVLKSFTDGFAKKIARGLDIAAIHGVNPRTNQDSEVVGNNCFKKKVTNAVEAASGDANEKVEAAVDMVDTGDGDVNGMAMSKTFASALSKVKDGDRRLFPELAWGAAPSTLNGLTVSKNSTVNYKGGKIDAVLGDFENAFKWGFAQDVTFETIEYGNPDNNEQLGDLKGHGQVYLRCEAFIGWGVIDPSAFALIKAA